MNDPNPNPGTTGALEATDAAAAAVQKTPRRVTLDYLQSRIAQETYYHPHFTPHMTICVLRMKNGFTVIGQSTPADPGNFNLELGKKLARENAIGHMWPLEGFLLCEEIYQARGAKLDDGMYDDMIARAEASRTEGGVTDETGAGAGLSIGAQAETSSIPAHLQHTAPMSAQPDPGNFAEGVGSALPGADAPEGEAARVRPDSLPTIGRVVHVLMHQVNQPIAAMVTGLNPDGTIDATLFLRHAAPDYATGIDYGLAPDAVMGWVWPSRA